MESFIMKSVQNIHKIGFDAKRAVANMTGLGNYSRFTIEALSENLPDTDFFLYAPKLQQNPRLSSIQENPHIKFISPNYSGLKSALWRSFSMTRDIRRDALDIFHGLSNELPLNIARSGIPSVVTMHDLIYRRFPQGYKRADRKIYDFKYRHSCISADRIIAISECTKRDIIDLYHIPEEKIDVVYQGCHPQFYQPASPQLLDEVLERYALPEDYILQVGTIEERKNLELTVRALSALPKKYRLVVIGKNRLDYLSRCKEISAELGIGKRILHLKDVPFHLLPALYQRAKAVAYPSRYEGFGLPVIEAIASGCPVVAAKGSCLEEAGGKGAIYIDPDSPQALAEALKSILESGEQRSEMIAEGKKHISAFSKENFISATLATYLKAIKNKL